MLSTKSGSKAAPALEAVHDTKAAQLVQLGFTEEQAAHVLSGFASRTGNLNITHVQPWLQLLRKLHVDNPIQVVSKHAIILASKPAAAEGKAARYVGWLIGLGATPERVAALISKRPMLLNIPNATPIAVAAWLQSKLDLSSSDIVNVFDKCPELFGQTHQELDLTLDWFISNEVSIEMVQRKPQLLGCNLSSIVTKTKARFLIQAMRKDAQELLTSTTFFKFSLLDRIGPRWVFHLLHCKDQPFVLSTKLNCIDADFLRRLNSPSLDAECTFRSMTRQQLFDESMSNWKAGEGKEWDVESNKRASKKQI